MSKLVSLFSLVTIIVSFSVSAFGQSADLREDLKNSFTKFDLVRINNENAQRQASENELVIRTAAKNFRLKLVPNDLRARNYRAEDTTAVGTRVLEKGAVTTFKGYVVGENSSEVRLLIDGTTVEGYFISEGKRHFIEPAKRHSKFAGKDDFVVYAEGGLLENSPLVCHTDVGEKLERGKNFVSSKTRESVSAVQVIELATDADFEYVTLSGGAAASNNEILGILNMVEGVFQRELNLTISVVYQHTWTTSDPFSSANLSTLLASFKDHWNANYTHVARDAAHLWTGKAVSLNQGRAYNAVVCSHPAFAYAVSGRTEWSEAKNLITGHEIAHTLGANHAEAEQSCAGSLMNAVVFVNTPLSFCSFSRSEVTNFVALNGSCLSAQTGGNAQTRFDFDRDGKSDVAVFRPSNGVWYVLNSSGGYNIFQFGQNGDLPVSTDFDGDGKDDAGIYRGGTWYRLKSSTGSYDGIAFGLPTDIPAAADFDGDGKSDIAVFRPSNGVWYILKSSGGVSAVQFGTVGDVPMPGDYDGDGKADINLYRPSNGVWYRLNSGSGSFFAVQFGAPGDKAVSGDFDGDGKYDQAVFRGANGGWYILRSSNNSLQAVNFGISGDLPVAGDYDGDGKTDISVFRPSNGSWFRLNSSNNSFAAAQFGISSDIPVQSYYVK
jgi:hypothetical protein